MQYEINMWTLHSWLKQNNVPHFYSLEEEPFQFSGFRLPDYQSDPKQYALLSSETDNTLYHSVLTFGKNRIYFQEHNVSEAVSVLNRFEDEYRHWIETFFQKNLENCVLEDLLENAFQYLPYPTVVFCDSQLVATGPGAESFAGTLLSIPENSDISDLLSHPFAQKMITEYPCVSDFSTSENGHRGHIMIDRLLIGRHYIWILMYDTSCGLTPGSLQLVQYLREAIFHNLSHNSQNALKRFTALDDYFLSCKVGEFPSPELTRRVFGQLHWKPDNVFCVWRIEFADASASIFMNLICQKLRDAFPNAHVMLSPNGILMVLHAEHEDMFLDDPLILQYFSSDAFVAGKSTYGTGYELLPDLIRQAFHAAESCRKYHRCFMDASDIVSEFIYKKLHENDSVQALIHPAVHYLAEIDRGMKHPYSCLLTLKTFLLCGGNYNETAKRLQIHRNTLVNRIRQISEFAGITDIDSEFEALLLSIFLLSSDNF